MSDHGLTGRKQTPEHIAKRVQSVRVAKESWSEEKSQEFRLKISEVTRNRPKEIREKFMYANVGREPWNKGKKFPQYSGSNHWNWGNNMPQESIEKTRQSLTGKKQSPELIAKRFATRAGYRHSEETKAKIGRANSGEGNGNWLGGLTPYPRTYFKAREAIRNRDGHKCVICDAGENGHRHDVHHIDYDKKNIDPENLVTLCHLCHGKTNHNRESWKRFFTEI